MFQMRRAAAGVGAALSLLMVGGCGGGQPATPAGSPGIGAGSPAISAVPTETTGPAPILPGTAGHFDNGSFSFDYPTDWPVIASDVYMSGAPDYVVAVLGDGSWEFGCRRASSGSVSSTICGPDVVQVPASGVVLKVFWRRSGPGPSCQGNTQANATLGSNAVDTWTSDAATSWEIRMPGGEFGWPNNPTFEVHTADPAQFARAEAVVASFRWNPGEVGYGSPCSPAPN